ncbi:MAG TPA: hypothetical protein VNJ02_04525 [Vicinamibacterales bacterium]|nr:hypothetical protein [Vicinamibacterales bacterium]
MTWPLALGLSRDVPGDLGDSLLNMWILGWGAENLPRVATGQMSVGEFWNANIFHPEPLALSFSEHLFGQVLQILPIYHLTGNLILAYNLLFVSTFILSGLGMFLLVRELTGNAWAAFVAGVIFAFVPFRIAQVAHLQSLSSQWMPLALYGFLRFIRTTRLRPLAGGTAALLMQNWSCGYYLMFFAPFVAFFVVHRTVAEGRLGDWRVWASFAGAAIVVLVGTWPFLDLYLQAQRVHGFERSIGEVIRFSADVYSYATAPEALRLWGGVLQTYPKPEGELFFGLLPLLLTLAAIAMPSAHTANINTTPRLTTVARILAIMLLVLVGGFVAIVMTGGFVTSLFGIPIRATNPSRAITSVAIVMTILLATSGAARARAVIALRSPLALAVTLMLLAMWLSLGPAPQSRGEALSGLGIYRALYDHVPGFDGLRVPARYAMVAAVFLALAAGYGAAALLSRVARPALWTAVLVAIFLIEAAFAPMAINQTWGDDGVTPPARVEPRFSAPAVYRHLATLDDARVVTELPFGDPAWELRYVYYSTVHWKRLVNGYSGAFPPSYKTRAALLTRIPDNSELAWQALVDAGTTHLIVHNGAFAPSAADSVHAWLLSRGAVNIGQFNEDVLYAVIPDP